MRAEVRILQLCSRTGHPRYQLDKIYKLALDYKNIKDLQGYPAVRPEVITILVHLDRAPPPGPADRVRTQED